MSKPIFIAEIKTKSPFGFESKYPFIDLMQYAITYGDWISVHTNALWGGDYEALAFVRKCTDKPILAKGLHATTESILKAFEYGADYVLTTNLSHATAFAPKGEWFKLSGVTDKILFEENASKILSNCDFNSTFLSRKYVCNSRDLQTGLPKMKWPIPDFLELKKKGVWICQASGIKSYADVEQQFDAFIVGEHLINFCKELDCNKK